MDETSLYHGLYAVFGALALVYGAVELASSIRLSAGLVAISGLGLLLVSATALVRPSVGFTDEPGTWHLVGVGIAVALFGAGAALSLS